MIQFKKDLKRKHCQQSSPFGILICWWSTSQSAWCFSLPLWVKFGGTQPSHRVTKECPKITKPMSPLSLASHFWLKTLVYSTMDVLLWEKAAISVWKKSEWWWKRRCHRCRTSAKWEHTWTHSISRPGLRNLGFEMPVQVGVGEEQLPTRQHEVLPVPHSAQSAAITRNDKTALAQNAWNTDKIHKMPVEKTHF